MRRVGEDAWTNVSTGAMEPENRGMPVDAKDERGGAEGLEGGRKMH